MSYIPIVNLIVAKKNTDQIKDEFQSFFASDSSGIIKLSRIQANMIDSAETSEEAYSIINEYRKTKLNNESNIVLNAFNELVPLSYSLNEVREISGRLNKPYVLGKIDGLNVALIDFDIKKDTDLEFLYEQKRLILSDESEVVNNRFKIYVNNYDDGFMYFNSL